MEGGAGAGQSLGHRSCTAGTSHAVIQRLWPRRPSLPICRRSPGTRDRYGFLTILPLTACLSTTA